MGSACKALVVLIGATGCLAAVAYAATVHAVRRQNLVDPAGAQRLIDPSRRQGIADLDAIGRRSGDSGPGAMIGGVAPPAPRLAAHPAKASLSTSAAFRLHRAAGLSFVCQLDSGDWQPCGARVDYRGLADGRHRFRVRAVDQFGRRSPITRFAWEIVAPVDFSISFADAALEPLYPGAPPSQLPLRLTNPNPRAIYVTGVAVEVTASPPGCDAAVNLSLTPSSASSAAPLRIPAGASVDLPAPGISAPAIQLRDLPVDQDACQGASFGLAFRGSAHG